MKIFKKSYKHRPIKTHLKLFPPFSKLFLFKQLQFFQCVKRIHPLEISNARNIILNWEKGFSFVLLTGLCLENPITKMMGHFFPERAKSVGCQRDQLPSLFHAFFFSLWNCNWDLSQGRKGGISLFFKTASLPVSREPKKSHIEYFDQSFHSLEAIIKAGRTHGIKSDKILQKFAHFFFLNFVGFATSSRPTFYKFGALKPIARISEFHKIRWSWSLKLVTYNGLYVIYGLPFFQGNRFTT